MAKWLCKAELELYSDWEYSILAGHFCDVLNTLCNGCVSAKMEKGCRDISDSSFHCLETVPRLSLLDKWCKTPPAAMIEGIF